MKNKNLFLTITAFLYMIQLSAQLPKTHSIGAMKNMGTTYDLNIWLDTISNKPHLYGMGPYDKMKGEITVVNGKPYVASAFIDGAFEVGKDWDIRSPFFVYSNISKWDIFEIEGDLNNVHDIQEKVATIAKENGYNLDQPFAFKIKGEFDAVTAHIVTPRLPEVEGYREGIKSQKFSFENAHGEFIGFYSEHHQGVFTHMDGFVHVHFLMKDKTFMGHLDKISTKGKTITLYLPKNQ
ncbi:acetolactate decarboxylase [Flagellimonas profundi]|uniref:Acetolactate decarboxylase n=1 Tax=Flagellimonas profundi TaxID=2915620 RepID=A0ABS3FBL6_9FLAO|nr:acetolactate decarboxylase [Allomuricauda profundi]MBO0340548.1 acetolactate decarboxylase [Allomuricauda profundi]